MSEKNNVKLLVSFTFSTLHFFFADNVNDNITVSSVIAVVRWQKTLNKSVVLEVHKSCQYRNEYISQFMSLGPDVSFISAHWREWGEEITPLSHI